LRQAVPQQLTSKMKLLYAQGHVCTPLQGTEITRHIQLAWPLQAWWTGDKAHAVSLAGLQGQPLWALAGVAAPEAFFAMLEQAGLRLQRHAMPDHSPYEQLPWPADTPDVITTEKDAVKLRAALGGRTRVWVVPLDLVLPAALLHDVMALLPAAKPALP
jgi:tetraacyldisaccharide 4'-kinase